METMPKIMCRRYPRYLISGDVQLFAVGSKGTARLVQFGLGGMLLQAAVILPIGKRVTAKIRPDDYALEVEVPAEVVGVRDGLMAAKFLGSPGPVLDVGRWLAARKQPVAPLPNLSELVARLKHTRHSPSIPGWSAPGGEESVLEFLFAKTQMRTSLSY